MQMTRRNEGHCRASGIIEEQRIAIDGTKSMVVIPWD